MDAHLSLEEAFAFLDECDTDIFADARALLATGENSPLLWAPAASGASAPTEKRGEQPARGKKKRVRRQKLELEYLRKLVVELEDKLGQLKRVTGGPSLARRADASPVATTSSEDEDDADSCGDAASVSSPVSAATTRESSSQCSEGDADSAGDELVLPSSVATLWMGVAERQYKERLRAEHQNQKLKAMLEAQIKLANSLEKLLTKRPSEEAIESVSTTKRVKRHLELTSNNDVVIFEQQLADVARAHLDVDLVFAKPEYRGPVTFSDTRVNNTGVNDSNNVGISYEFLSSAVLPFNLTTASNAFWRLMAFESIKKHTYYQRDMQVTDNLVARTYGLDIKLDKFEARFCGKQTVRKYVEADRIVIVWKQLLEPSKVNGTKFHGLQCHETGWVLLKQSNPEGAAGDGMASSTTMQAFATSVPHLEDDIVDQELQIGALTNFVMGFHELSVALSCQLMADLLLEEDWKTTQQFEGMTL